MPRIRIEQMVTTENTLFVKDTDGKLWRYSPYHMEWQHVELPSMKD